MRRHWKCGSIASCGEPMVWPIQLMLACRQSRRVATHNVSVLRDAPRVGDLDKQHMSGTSTGATRRGSRYATRIGDLDRRDASGTSTGNARRVLQSNSAKPAHPGWSRCSRGTSGSSRFTTTKRNRRIAALFARVSMRSRHECRDGRDVAELRDEEVELLLQDVELLLVRARLVLRDVGGDHGEGLVAGWGGDRTVWRWIGADHITSHHITSIERSAVSAVEESIQQRHPRLAHRQDVGGRPR